MRREYVEYIKDLPINIYLADIREKPINWQNSIQIVFVLKGTIDVGVENEIYTLSEREIEIINSNEVYSIKSNTENLVLILQIDPRFFERYYEDANEVFFYTDAPDKKNQDDEKYKVLKEYVSILLYESISKLDDYEDQIEENLLKLMYHLLNNFHYLYYEGEGETLKDDEEQMERYHRIVKYLSNNYMNKVSLQDIAEKEFLSSQYLSYKIKNILGHGFNEFLNQIRVEESTKILLDTDKKISEVSEEVGFSHVRYYNKHFKIHYKLTPLQYRKKYKLKKKDLDKITNITYKDISEAIDYLTQYIEDYERYNYDNRIITLDINLKGETIEYFKSPDMINLGDISLLLEEENRRILEEAQREIGFKYALINRLFSDDMDIYKGKNQRFINWTRVENIIDFIKTLKLMPIISVEGVEKHIIDDFIYSFSIIYDEDVSKWLDYDTKNLKLYFLKEDINLAYDTITMVPYILYNYLYLNNRIVLNIIDEISGETILDNDTFFGGQGIYTSNCLNKPSYYALMFLSLLGEEVIDKGQGYIVTRSQEGYQILFYNPVEIDENSIYSGINNERSKERRISTNIFRMEEDFQIIRYDLNEEFGSVYNKWINLGSVERIDKYHWDLLKRYIYPNISFYYSKKATILNLRTTVRSKGATLYRLNKVLS